MGRGGRGGGRGESRRAGGRTFSTAPGGGGGGGGGGRGVLLSSPQRALRARRCATARGQGDVPGISPLADNFSSASSRCSSEPGRRPSAPAAATAGLRAPARPARPAAPGGGGSAAWPAPGPRWRAAVARRPLSVRGPGGRGGAGPATTAIPRAPGCERRPRPPSRARAGGLQS